MDDDDIPQELRELADSVKAGATPTTTPRRLISWFGAQRRGFWVTVNVDKALASLGIETYPNYEYEWLDAEITVRKAAPKPLPTQANDKMPSTGSDATSPDPTYRIGKLEAANRVPTSVAPDAPISRAVTLMMTHDFSQLPVMQGERTVKGMVSWATLGQRLAFGLKVTTVSDCSATHHEISADTSLFDAIDGIVKHGYALIRAGDNRISGIVTTTDLGLQFGRLGEPFLLIGEVENYLRRLIASRFDITAIQGAKDPADTARVVSSVDDLTFGEYVRLLEAEDRWQTVAIRLDRDVFVKGLQEIRRIRNDVMHFDPDGPSQQDILTLRQWVSLFQRLSSLTVI